MRERVLDEGRGRCVKSGLGPTGESVNVEKVASAPPGGRRRTYIQHAFVLRFHLFQKKCISLVKYRAGSCILGQLDAGAENPGGFLCMQHEDLK